MKQNLRSDRCKINGDDIDPRSSHWCEKKKKNFNRDFFFFSPSIQIWAKINTEKIKLFLSSFIGNLFNQSDYSDIQLVVESEQFYAHRIILAARSEYFRALLFGGLKESQQKEQVITIKECKSAAFKYLLLYIYTARINLMKEKVKSSPNQCQILTDLFF